MDKIVKCINSIPSHIFNLFLTRQQQVIYDNIKFEFIGAGGEGVVYKALNFYAVKIYKSIVARETIIEMKSNEVAIMKKSTELLKQSITINFLELFQTFDKLNHTVLIMELVTGNLEEWCNEHHTDDEWINMILQILYNVIVMQKCLLMYHADMKPKNILYKKLSKPMSIAYTIKGDNKISFVIKTSYIFIIADFGHSNSLLLKHNELDNDKIKYHIEHNSDLDHLIYLYSRLAVNKIQDIMTIDDLLKVAGDDKLVKTYYENEINKINTEMRDYPKHIKNRMIFRSVAYYLLEKNLLDVSKIVKNSMLPTKYVKDTLEDLGNEKLIIDMIKKILIVDHKQTGNQIDVKLCVLLD